MTRTILFLFALIAMQVSVAFGADFKKSTPEMVEKGKKIFATNCATCHGEKGEGNGPAGAYLTPKPANFAAGKFKYGGEAEQLFKTVSTGVDGTAMIAYTHLSEEDRWSVVHFIKTLKK
jgi:mono/diheme cytochrome c family protein